jgi:Domain of unknown function (DUF1707)/Cell wall-active antibiotics response 4TMS YvqF
MDDDASLRISDADREQAVISLREHLLAGRLTLEEFSERVEGALRARVGAELARVQEDLPQITRQAGQQGHPGRKPARVTAALLAHTIRRRLRLRGWTFAASALGDLDLDLREATIDRPKTAVTLLAVAGNIDVYVPEGVSVNVSGLSIFGHIREWGLDVARPDAPAVHVRVLGCAGTIDVWRVPHDMLGSSYDDVIRQAKGRQRQLPA